jgi:hypothetical protein
LKESQLIFEDKDMQIVFPHAVQGVQTAAKQERHAEVQTSPRTIHRMQHQVIIQEIIRHAPAMRDMKLSPVKELSPVRQ